MQDLITVFRMTEVSVDVRIKVLRELGSAINMQYGTNMTEKVIIELIKLLDPNYVFTGHLAKYIEPEAKP